ncbi:MAG TPA: polyhydroxyalkanoic acid system family protein [Rhodanobacteraceae bacterium]|nr:polyhydroxyalkanoic acid system family protein [Rhodanobacteraceae bacterium]
MPTIDIRRTHRRSPDEVRNAIEQVMASIGERFGIRHRWQGGGVAFSRAGVNGRVDLGPGIIHIHAELGFLLAGLKPSIVREIEHRLDREFGPADSA